MALIKLSALVNQISGKLGGSVFLFGKNGQVVKTNSYSQPQFSNIQTTVQQHIQFVASRWQLVDTITRQSWQDAVPNYPYVNKIGVISTYTAYQLFLKLNENLQVIGNPITLAPPIFESVNLGGKTISSFSINNLSIGLELLIIGQSIAFYTSPVFYKNVNPGKLNYRLIATKIISSQTQNFQLYSDFTSIFAPPTSGGSIYWYYRIISTTSGNSTNASEYTYLQYT